MFEMGCRFQDGRIGNNGFADLPRFQTGKPTARRMRRACRIDLPPRTSRRSNIDLSPGTCCRLYGFRMACSAFCKAARFRCTNAISSCNFFSSVMICFTCAGAAPSVRFQIRTIFQRQYVDRHHPVGNAIWCAKHFRVASYTVTW